MQIELFSLYPLAHTEQTEEEVQLRQFYGQSLQVVPDK
jgi:hypothetical protein